MYLLFRYDENDGRVEPDYPRDMSMWKGVGYNIDSVFQWKDGKPPVRMKILKLQTQCNSQGPNCRLFALIAFFISRKNLLLQRERLLEIQRPPDEGGTRATASFSSEVDGLSRRASGASCALPRAAGPGLHPALA